jgi:hypothetical protein
VSSLYELEPLPLRDALDAIGGAARQTGKLPLRLMQPEVDRLLEAMPRVPMVSPPLALSVASECAGREQAVRNGTVDSLGLELD